MFHIHRLIGSSIELAFHQLQDCEIYMSNQKMQPLLWECILLNVPSSTAQQCLANNWAQSVSCRSDGSSVVIYQSVLETDNTRAIQGWDNKVWAKTAIFLSFFSLTKFEKKKRGHDIIGHIVTLTFIFHITITYTKWWEQIWSGKLYV